MFIGTNDALYALQPTHKSVLVDGASRKRYVQSSLHIGEANDLRVLMRFRTSKESAPYQEQEIVDLDGNVIAAWRLLYLIDRLPLVSDAWLDKVLRLAADWHLSDQPHKERMEYCKQSKVPGCWDIMRTYPTQLSSALRVLRDRGVQINKAAIVYEMRAGRLPYTEGLRKVGITPLEAYDTRRHDEDRCIEALRPLIVQASEHTTASREDIAANARNLLRTGLSNRVLLLTAAAGLACDPQLAAPHNENGGGIDGFARDVGSLVAVLSRQLPQEADSRSFEELLREGFDWAVNAALKEPVYEIY